MQVIGDEKRNGPANLTLAFAPSLALWVVLVRHAQVSTEHVYAGLSESPSRRVIREAGDSVNARESNSRLLVAELSCRGRKSLREELCVLTACRVLTAPVLLFNHVLTTICENKGDYAAHGRHDGEGEPYQAQLIGGGQRLTQPSRRRSK